MINASTSLISSRIHVPSQCPKIVIAVGPCRSGTTAQLRVFAENGIPSWHQPIKAILREYRNPTVDFTIPSNQPVLFIKETLGPFTEQESRLNPIQILLEAGVPPERISLLVSLREPLSTACSWVEQFSFGVDKSVLLSHLIISYQSVDAAARLATKEDIPVSTFLFESLRDNDIDHVMSRLFSHLSLPYQPGSLQNWNMLPPMNSPESHIIFPFQSEMYANISEHRYHEKVERSDSFKYYQKDPAIIDQSITVDDATYLEHSEVFDLYDRYRTICTTNYDINIRASRELDTYFERHGILRHHEGNTYYHALKTREG